MKIVNIVCSGDFQSPVDLNLLSSLNNPSFQYSKDKYHGGYYRTSFGKATIYSSGKYIIAGLKSPDNVDPAFRELCEFISPIISTTDISPPQIQNIVGSEEFHTSVNLNKIFNSMQFENIEYEPEQFPGLIIHENGCTALVFSSGKVILPGGKSIEGLEKWWEHLKEVILKI